jgi:lipopolysaccharide transport system ATP-binding protein
MESRFLFMNSPIISIEHLSKTYHLGQIGTGTLSHDLNVWWAKMRGKPNPMRKIGESDHGNRDIGIIWALNDVDLTIGQGEVLGIIGKNGAGKSTLLKILARVTAPTSGKVKVKGRIASLLEVGTGFHPDLTGRENIYLNGAILGMNRKEIDRKFDEIVEFSGVEKFIDTPVKRYSSGMYVRLAFAVAAHLEPEILLVDEVLAVGDAEFQKKCMGKMDDVSHQGRTILFVSHNMVAIQNICRKTIVLENGKVGFSGDTPDGIGYYLAVSDSCSTSLINHPDRKGSGEIKIQSIEFFDATGKPIKELICGQNLEIHLNYKIEEDFKIEKILVGLSLSTPLGTPVFLHHNRITKDFFGPISRNGTFICKIKKFPLAPSSYTLGFSIMPNLGHDGWYYDTIENAMSLNVVFGDYYATGEIPPATHGFVLIDARWELGEN